MLTIIFSVAGVFIGIAIGDIFINHGIKKDKRIIELMHYFDTVGYDENDPKYNELGILLHGKREWKKRLNQSKKMNELFEKIK